MNANTLKAITRHGESLLNAFPNALEKNPVVLCKKLRRIETFIGQYLLQNCNHGMDETRLDGYCHTAIARAGELLGIAPSYALSIGLHINRDPRGFALKLSSEWVLKYNETQYLTAVKDNCRPIYTDMGGYGILAPNLNTK